MTSPHTFHIPVMGIAYTIDSPIKVAHYGISSVISIVEDRLLEMMRKYYSYENNKPYTAITENEEDYRARRITEYLNLVYDIVQEKLRKLKSSAFEAGSEIVKYFEMLPGYSTLKQLYYQMQSEPEENKKLLIQEELRNKIVAGSIDVNIMAKIDKDNYAGDGSLIENGSDALAAMRGYMNSTLSNSAVIFSAGMNPRLYNYLESFESLLPNEKGEFKKRIIIKVSDYRSALIQGKMLAKKGVWVSEFRIESGLNCGGHAFATDGFLMGPILREFTDKKDELAATMFSLYKEALVTKGGPSFENPLPIRFSAQGGIGTHEEAEFLRSKYGIDSTGWGTPFLLCPEATTVDENTLQKLASAMEDDVILSHNSPLGVRFHYLKGMGAGKERLSRVEKGRPGSPCTEKYLVSNTEFTTEPICTASSKYQKLKLAELQAAGLTAEKFEREKETVVNRECLCVGLSNSAAINYNQPFLKRQEEVTICPGPNIAYFDKKVSLKQMTDHIYGRDNILSKKSRPHMFIKELQLYTSYFSEMVEEYRSGPGDKQKKKLAAFYTNLLNGIEYYQTAMDSILGGYPAAEKENFIAGLKNSKSTLDNLFSKTG